MPFVFLSFIGKYTADTPIYNSKVKPHNNVSLYGYARTFY